MNQAREENLRSFCLTDSHENVCCILHLVLVENVVLRGNSVPRRIVSIQASIQDGKD